MLKNLTLKPYYDSDADNISKDFIIPALKESTNYDMCVGYFNAGSLCVNASGFSHFINQNGKIRLIVAATVSKEELDSMEEGYTSRELLRQQLQDSITKQEILEEGFFQNRLKAISVLIEREQLDVKIAFMIEGTGILHYKIRIFSDEDGNKIVTNGSGNETTAAYAKNAESFNVFTSWNNTEREHQRGPIEKFENIWDDNTPNIKAINVTDVVKNYVDSKIDTKYYNQGNIKLEEEYWNSLKGEPYESPIITEALIKPTIPKQLNGRDFKLKDHQKDVLQNWQKNEYRGIFDLATGSGKTITSIFAATTVFISVKKLFVVVSVPYKNLAEQWKENLDLFGWDAIVCNSDNNWKPALKAARRQFEHNRSFVAVVVVNNTLSSKDFSNEIKEIKEKYLFFIGDECHHQTTPTFKSALPSQAKYRIGLSATWEVDDKEGNQILLDYYSDVLKPPYTLEQALKDKVLTPYRYYLEVVPLTDEEANKYGELSKLIDQLNAIISNKNDKENSDGLKKKMLQHSSERARLIQGCSKKNQVLEELLINKYPKPIKHSLFYCAEGGENIEDNDLAIKHISSISELLYKLGWKTSKFTAEEKKTVERKNILNSFKNGSIDSLVAMRCLDEGIDIPACKIAFILASSRQERQWVQRRGRILRLSDGKDEAIIYDFLVTAPNSKLDELRLIKSQLKRIHEFAKTSIEENDAISILMPYIKKYNLIDDLIK